MYSKTELTEIRKQIYLRYMYTSTMHYGSYQESDFKLQLKPLSSITDEDIYTVAKMQGFINNNDFSIYFSNGQFKWDDGNTWGQFLESTLYSESYQYLQLKGYALPMLVILNGKPITLSVEHQIESLIIETKN